MNLTTVMWASVTRTISQAQTTEHQVIMPESATTST